MATALRCREAATETGEIIEFGIVGEVLSVATRSDSLSEDGGPGAPSASEIAAQLTDPNASIGSLNFNFDYIAFDGDLPDAGDQSALKVSFQPSLPYSLKEGTNLFMRPLIPLVINQDVPSTGGGFDSKGVDLGDISFDATITRNFPFFGGTVLGGTLVGTLPTATYVASPDIFGPDWQIRFSVTPVVALPR